MARPPVGGTPHQTHSSTAPTVGGGKAPMDANRDSSVQRTRVKRGLARLASEAELPRRVIKVLGRPASRIALRRRLLAGSQKRLPSAAGTAAGKLLASTARVSSVECHPS